MDNKPLTKKFYVYSEGHRKPCAITAINREEALAFAGWINRDRPGARYRVTPFRGNPWKHVWLARPWMLECIRIVAEAEAEAFVKAKVKGRVKRKTKARAQSEVR